MVGGNPEKRKEENSTLKDHIWVTANYNFIQQGIRAGARASKNVHGVVNQETKGGNLFSISYIKVTPGLRRC